MAHFSHSAQAPSADMYSEDEEEDFSDSEGGSGPESESDSEDQYGLLRYRAADPRDATFRPGVGPFIVCSVLPRYPYDVRLVPDGPCAISFGDVKPAWSRDVPGWLTIPKDAAAANTVNWAVAHGVLDAAQRLGITCGRGIAAASWFRPRTEGPDGRPFPLVVRPEHAANVDALLALHGVASRHERVPRDGGLRRRRRPARVPDAPSRPRLRL